MFITKMAISRRRALRGMGAAIALPMLDAMVPAMAPKLSAAVAPTRRFGGIFIPMGMRPGYWNPETTGTDFELTPLLKPLAPVREYMTLISNLDDPTGGHDTAPAGWLTASRQGPNGQPARFGTSLDQVLGPKIGADTPLQTLELAGEEITAYTTCGEQACVYANTMAWKTPTTPLNMEVNPRRVFERLYGVAGTKSQQQTRMQEDRSILDSVRNDMAGLGRQLGPRDRSRVNDYLDYVREVEQRVQKLEAKAASNVDIPDPPVGIPETWEENTKLMYDFIVLAWQGDITRVITFMTAHEASKMIFPSLGISEAWHPLSHHGNDPAKMADMVRINLYHMEIFGKFLERMKSVPDGDGTLLDHSLILFGSGMSESDAHSPIDVPTLLMGGASGQLKKGGRHIQSAKGTPLANLMVSIANKFDLGVEKFGTLSTGHVDI